MTPRMISYALEIRSVPNDPSLLHGVVEPLPNCMARTGVERQIQRDSQKREGCAVVAATFRRKHMSDVRGHMLVGEFATNNGLCQDRIGRGDSRGDDEARKEGETGHKGPDEEGRDHPSVDHARSEEEYE